MASPFVSFDDKFSSIAVFSLGFLAIAVSVGRIAANIDVWMPTLCAWSTSEQAVGIVVACTPPLKWLVKGFALGVAGKRGTFYNTTMGGVSAVSAARAEDEEKCSEAKASTHSVRLEPGERSEAGDRWGS